LFSLMVQQRSDVLSSTVRISAVPLRLCVLLFVPKFTAETQKTLRLRKD